MIASLLLALAPAAHASGVVPEDVDLPGVVEASRAIVVAKRVGAPEPRVITFPEPKVPPYEYAITRWEVQEILFQRADGLVIEPPPPTVSVGAVLPVVPTWSASNLDHHLAYHRDGLSRWVIERRYTPSSEKTTHADQRILFLEPLLFDGQAVWTHAVSGGEEVLEARPKVERAIRRDDAPGKPAP